MFVGIFQYSALSKTVPTCLKYKQYNKNMIGYNLQLRENINHNKICYYLHWFIKKHVHTNISEERKTL